MDFEYEFGYDEDHFDKVREGEALLKSFEAEPSPSVNRWESDGGWGGDNNGDKQGAVHYQQQLCLQLDFELEEEQIKFEQNIYKLNQQLREAREGRESKNEPQESKNETQDIMSITRNMI